jgi:hypothetical protein
MSQTRRQFLVDAGRVALWLPAGWILVQAACTGEGSDECGNADAVATTATTVTVTSSCAMGHTHDFTVQVTDLQMPPSAGVSGQSTPYEDGHVHSVELTGAELGQIEAGATLTKTSGATNGHVHTFAFRKTPSSGSGSGGGKGGY